MAEARRNRFARWSAAARRFVGARTGSATVELALLLPVAIGILGLAVFGGEGMSVKRKVTLATRDVGDLVAQTVLPASANTTGIATIDSATLNYYLSLSSLIVYPYDPTQLAVEISEIQVQVNPAPTTTGNPPTVTATVMWSEANSNGTARACGSTLTVSSDVVQALIPPTPTSNPQYSYLILAESQYNFQPPGIGNTMGAFPITAQVFMVPRSASQIALNPRPC
jgi:Flp pilus assembly protein TadG